MLSSHGRTSEPGTLGSRGPSPYVFDIARLGTLQCQVILRRHRGPGLPGTPALFVAQGFDRVEPRGFPGGIVAEDDSDGDRDRDRPEHGEE